MSRILLCQCADPMSRELEQALAADEISVTSCANGESLLDTLLRERPDAVVHVLRPDPHEDIGLLRLVRRAAPDVPLILLAENGSLEIQRQIIELRPIFYDVVPVGPADLVDAVHAAIGRRAASPPQRVNRAKRHG